MSIIQSEYIETERLMLRRLTPEEYDRLMLKGTDDDIRAFFSFINNEQLRAEKEKHKKGITTYYISFLTFHMIEKSSGRIIGACGYHTVYQMHSRAEIGYGLTLDEDKGKGYMKEALAAIIRYGFEIMQLNRIEAFVGPKNAPSNKLMEHFGFVKEGHMREHYFKEGQLEDSLAYGLLKSEYEAR
ncbi:MAG: acetyltransferase, ribosomal protein N-acetylase [Bacteroidetes bacterium]|jgi:ribosomal-protein-alanine N-acetyltransferase|nr:acetyltransferase, ribosomal protein N-acetylase [Bacteroidota bacterium]